jgi:Exopolysaccharide biosynthesis protein YbjH
MFSLVIYPGLCLADDEPFTGTSNWGGTGLMETPTARILPYKSFRLGLGQVSPYRYYYGALSPLKGLEIDGRLTEVLDTASSLAYWKGYGNYKDKAIDLKYQVMPEGKYLPAVAVGVMDPYGTRVYASQYLVASKQIYPFDFTVGLGNGRFGKRPLPSDVGGLHFEMLTEPKQWLSDAQFFGGIQFMPSDNYALMVEYNPIRYDIQTADPAQKIFFDKPVPSHFNFGLRWRPAKWAEVDVSYQRGNRIGVNLSTTFNIGKPLIPIYNPPYVEGSVERQKPYAERLATALHASGFSDIGVDIEGASLRVSAQNDKYYYAPEAIGAILSVVADIVPETVTDYTVVLTENDIPMVRFRTTRADVRDLIDGKLALGQFAYNAKISTDITETGKAREQFRKRFSYGLRPSFETFLNDPSGFFKYRAGVAGWVGYHPWQGSSFVAGLEGYPLNNISTINEPLSIPVRSDISLYKRQKLALGQLLFQQIRKFGHEIYLRGAAGLLEVEYAGLDGEAAMPLLNGRILVGLSGSVVRKRDPDSPFLLKADDIRKNYTTTFFNARLNIPEKDIFVDLKAGRFLAGDVGSRITISKFINGVILSVWYSVTDTSKFTDSFNRGYHDKGFSVTIPLRLFEGTDSRTAYSYALSPWTRDVAQDIEHYTSLFDFIGRNTKIYLDRDREMMQNLQK